MINAMLNNGLVLTLDPLDHFKTDPERIVDALGYIPAWLSRVDEYPSIKAALVDQYIYYMGDMTGGKIDKRGIYRFPDDPPLYPLASAEIDGERFYQYQYGIVATVTSDGAQWVSRFD